MREYVHAQCRRYSPCGRMKTVATEGKSALGNGIGQAGTRGGERCRPLISLAQKEDFLIEDGCTGEGNRRITDY
jgi:hypothetical protein